MTSQAVLYYIHTNIASYLRDTCADSIPEDDIEDIARAIFHELDYSNIYTQIDNEVVRILQERGTSAT